MPNLRWFLFLFCKRVNQNETKTYKIDTTNEQNEQKKKIKR